MIALEVFVGNLPLREQKAAHSVLLVQQLVWAAGEAREALLAERASLAAGWAKPARLCRTWVLLKMPTLKQTVSEIDLQTSVTRPVAGYVSIPRRREGSQLSQRNFSSDFPSLAGRWLAWTP